MRSNANKDVGPSRQ